MSAVLAISVVMPVTVSLVLALATVTHPVNGGAGGSCSVSWVSAISVPYGYASDESIHAASVHELTAATLAAAWAAALDSPVPETVPLVRNCRIPAVVSTPAPRRVYTIAATRVQSSSMVVALLA